MAKCSVKFKYTLFKHGDLKGKPGKHCTSFVPPLSNCIQLCTYFSHFNMHADNSLID